jgi:subtilisin family serine protease
VPFTLFDERKGNNTDASRCDPSDNTQPEMKIEFWYRPLAAGATLTSEFRPPRGVAKSGPPLGGADVSGTYAKKYVYTISHKADTAPRPPSGSVTRNVLQIKFIVTKESSAGVVTFSYGTGKFKLRLTGPAGTKIQAWGDQFFEWHGIKLGHGPSEPANVKYVNAATIDSPGSSAGAIAVASYHDDTGKIQDLSSAGNLADYSGLGAYVDKPDVAAPGIKITAANGKNSVLSDLLRAAGQPYVTSGATSAAAPHVAGVAALMFKKKPTLKQADLLAKLKGKARATPPKDRFGGGKVDAKESYDDV